MHFPTCTTACVFIARTSRRVLDGARSVCTREKENRIRLQTHPAFWNRQEGKRAPDVLCASTAFTRRPI